MNRPLSTYDPLNIELDLKLRTMHGLGRGLGFEHQDTSILGDNEYSPIVANRCLQCVRMFLDSGNLSVHEIISSLRINFTPQPPTLSILLKDSQNITNSLLINENMELKNRINRIKKNKEKKERMNQILEDIQKLSRSNELCRSELVLREGNLQLIIYKDDASIFFYLREKIVHMSLNEWRQLKEKIIVKDEILEQAFWLWENIKINEYTNKFLTNLVPHHFILQELYLSSSY